MGPTIMTIASGGYIYKTKRKNTREETASRTQKITTICLHFSGREERRRRGQNARPVDRTECLHIKATIEPDDRAEPGYCISSTQLRTVKHSSRDSERSEEISSTSIDVGIVHQYSKTSIDLSRWKLIQRSSRVLREECCFYLFYLDMYTNFIC